MLGVGAIDLREEQVHKSKTKLIASVLVTAGHTERWRFAGGKKRTLQKECGQSAEQPGLSWSFHVTISSGYRQGCKVHEGIKGISQGDEQMDEKTPPKRLQIRMARHRRS